jgi:superfamily I DNA/RNA helicase
MYIRPEEWRPTLGITLEGTALDVVRSTRSLSVLAGPGAGKTELLAQRAAYLLNTGICPHPKRILAIAFKIDAARNLQARVEQRSTPELARRFGSVTFHAFAKRTLDQFREALPRMLRPTPDYKIMFPSRDSWAEYQRSVASEFPVAQGYNGNQFSALVQDRVPDFDIPEESTLGQMRRRWWEDCLKRTPSTITFDMMVLLANHIVNVQPIVRNAIYDTYTHVFLDEFQDVTGHQYELIKTIFKGSKTVVTAVGDTNQAIMGWAGAVPGIFNDFDDDFSAENLKLLFNYRSNSTIVDLINNLSQLFSDEKPVRTESARLNDQGAADALEGWLFKTRDAEGAGLADFVKTSLENDKNLKPHDFVILTRLRADAVEARLLPHFAQVDLRLRNESRAVGPLSLQDIVKDPVCLFLTSVLKMAHGVRDGWPFQVCRDLLANLEGIDLSTDKGIARSLRAVQEAVAIVTEISKDRKPADLDYEQLSRSLLPQERREQFARTFNEYQNREYLNSIVDGCLEFLGECAVDAATWPVFIGNIEGRDAVKIMTIHKSKGLEYHTVIFTELNDDAFWNNKDDVNVFFVALSRARERIRFSMTQDAKGFNNVRRFLKKLQDSGVAFSHR